MRELSEIEEKTYNFIKDADEVQTTNLPNERMWGTVPNLENMGLVEVSESTPATSEAEKRSLLKLRIRRNHREC